MSTQPHTQDVAGQRAEFIEATYECFSVSFKIRSPSEGIASAIDLVYGEMRTSSPLGLPLQIDIVPSPNVPDILEVFFNDKKIFEAACLGDLLHHFDNELTMAIELACPGLYFVHAAALADDARVTMLVGESGAGKSTTAYALAASGMDYLSDELAPLDPASGSVLAYPRAICLKKDPPDPLQLPPGHLRTEWTLHTAPSSLGCAVPTWPLPLARIVFVRYDSERSLPALNPITKGEAALKLYQGALNQLAHPCMGLDGTLALVSRADCYELHSAGIQETVRLLRETP